MMSASQTDALNLLEDGLQLWLVALRNAPEPQPELLNLFPNLAATLRTSTGKSQGQAPALGSYLANGQIHFISFILLL